MVRFTTDELVAGVRTGDRRLLAKTITLIESTRNDHAEQAAVVLSDLQSSGGGALRVGITGPPGAGKSTFIEALGQHLIEQGRRVGVLAVDPTSSRSGGSLLGDKTRMNYLATHPQAFIRPSPAGETLGGVARKTRESILVLDAAGYDVIIVETVGVGQSETMVAGMVDLFTLLHLPNAGDDLQGIKRGIMELADIIVVNKADGVMKEPAKQAARQLRNALSLQMPLSPNWEVPVQIISAIKGRGVEEFRKTMDQFHETMQQTGELEKRRQKQARFWMWDLIHDALKRRFMNNHHVHGQLPTLEAAVASGAVSPMAAAKRLLTAYGPESPHDGG